MKIFSRLVAVLPILFCFSVPGLTAGEQELIGAGATFPYPFTPKCCGYSEQKRKLHQAFGGIHHEAADITLPDDMRVSLTNTDAPDGYPISGFTWIIIYKDLAYGNRPEAKSRELVNLLWWMTHQGQKYTEPMHYAPLSKAAVQKAEPLIQSIMHGGNRVMK